MQRVRSFLFWAEYSEKKPPKLFWGAYSEKNTKRIPIKKYSEKNVDFIPKTMQIVFRGSYSEKNVIFIPKKNILKCYSENNAIVYSDAFIPKKWDFYSEKNIFP